MDQLVAPWRIDYILREKEKGCFFCRNSQQSADRENLIIIRDRTCFAMLNAYPYNPGHLMISPYKHTGDINELAEEELADLFHLTRRCKQLLQKAMKPEGYNIGINEGQCAGAGVLDHVHMHLVPRWNGDTNYMPVLGNTRVLPQALDDIYETLSKSL